MFTLVYDDFNPRSSCEERHLRAELEPRRRNFNPRSSCEERLEVRAKLLRDEKISIHAPHARSDFAAMFMSVELVISIHAPHARSDSHTILGLYVIGLDFNPRSSCEERQPGRSRWRARKSLFQSTLLMRGATDRLARQSCNIGLFQSTLLMRGATCAARLRRS